MKIKNMPTFMTRRRNGLPWGLILLSCCLAGLTGCKRALRPDGMPPLQPVELLFVQDGKPLADASISLMPEESSSAWLAGGVTDANGRLQPKTRGQYSGVAAGVYSVVVSKTETDLSSVKMTEYGPASPPDIYHLVEPKLADPATTTLKLEVDKGKKTETFDVGKAVRRKIVNLGP